MDSFPHTLISDLEAAGFKRGQIAELKADIQKWVQALESESSH